MGGPLSLVGQRATLTNNYDATNLYKGDNFFFNPRQARTQRRKTLTYLENDLRHDAEMKDEAKSRENKRLPWSLVGKTLYSQ